MRTRSILFSLASLSLMASCDPRVFDDLEDTLWVRADTEPGDSPSSEFGVGLVSAGGDDLRYFVASQTPPVLFLASFDEAGNRDDYTVVNIQEDGIGADPFPTPAVMAVDATAGAGVANVAVSIFDGTNARLYMVQGASGQSGMPLNLTGSQAPTGIAFGATDASSGVDLFAVSGENLNVVADYANGGSAVSCALGGNGSGLLAVDVDTAEGEEVLLGVAGEVQVSSGATLLSAAGANCFDVTAALATIAAPGNEASFGSVIRVGDFDGNDSADLVIAAPGENAVYVFLNWTVASPSAGTKINVPGGGESFGTSIATGDFDGDGRDELVITDPEADVGETRSAGSVYIYVPDASGDFGAAPIILHDATPEADQVFGQSLAIDQAFGGARLVVGAKNEVFTYFRTPVSGDIDFRN